ncbi:MATE family efflux transporter [Sphingomicrobium nitratireducens]|uniref:MATE family efflux transporter n=1 Tax=Sphingomicrobium nitratireducens TaxID=2964666 RepID=UPI0022409FA8|nr:MATE family efflux transporter [Sphingomicrobium nitratireducens]
MNGEATRTPGSWGHEVRATANLAWPLILSNLTMAGIGATDTWLLGRLGPTELAGAALALNLFFAFTLILLGIVTASSPLMATALGARLKSVTDVRRSFRQSVWLVLTVVPPIWLVMWNAQGLIEALGQEPRLAALGQTFLRGYMWSLLPFLFFQTLRNFVSALERPKWVFVLSAVGIPINFLLGYGLIFGEFGLPRMGIFGAGLAGTITWALLAVALVLVVLTDRQFRRFHLFGRFWRPDWERYARMWKLGLPIGLSMGFEGGVFSAAAYLMGLVGEKPLAAHAIALQIAAISFMVPWGISQAATVRVGLMLGRRDPQGMGRAGWTAFVMGVGFMSMMAVVLWLVPRELMTLFLEDVPANREVIALGASFLGIAAIFQIVDGAQVVGQGMLRGLHDTRWPMVFAFIGYWLVGIGVGAWLAFEAGWDGIGLWTGLASGLAIVSVLMMARWTMRERLGLTRDETSKKIPA